MEGRSLPGEAGCRRKGFPFARRFMTRQRRPARGVDRGRRAFLGSVAALPLLSALAEGRAAEPGAAPPRDTGFPGMITRQKNPDNLEFPFPTLNSFLTPNEQFFVRNHFEVPELEAKNW